jgi:hypothetical protein
MLNVLKLGHAEFETLSGCRKSPMSNPLRLAAADSEA